MKGDARCRFCGVELYRGHICAGGVSQHVAAQALSPNVTPPPEPEPADVLEPLGVDSLHLYTGAYLEQAVQERNALAALLLEHEGFHVQQYGRPFPVAEEARDALQRIRDGA